MGSDGARHHAGVRHEDKRLGITFRSGQLRDVRAGRHEEFIFLLRQVRNGKRDVPIERPHQKIHPVFFDQFRCRFDPRLRVRRVVRLDDRDLPAKYSPALIEEFHRDGCTVHVVNRRGLVRAGQGIDDPDFDRLGAMRGCNHARDVQHMVRKLAQSACAAGQCRQTQKPST